MAYVGQQPVVGRYILLDQISGGFNGTASGFTMTAGGQGVIPGLAQNVLLSLGGVIQQPGADYLVSGSGLTFTTPPVSGTTFFATVLGDAQAVGTPSDGTVIPASIASSGTFVFPNVTVTGVTTIASGTAAAPSLSISGDANTGLYSPGADQLAIATSGTGRLFVDASGNVSVGNSSAFDTASGRGNISVNGSSSALLALGVGASQKLAIYHGGTDCELNNLANGALSLKTNNQERLRITSSGLVGLGTSSPGAKLQVSQNTDAGTAISVVSASASTGLTTDYATLFLQNTNTTNNNYNAIGFVNDQGGYSSAIYGIYTSHTSGSQSGALAFSTRNAGTFDERMRITAAGNVGIGASTGLSNTLTVNGNTILLANGELKFADSTNSRVATIKNSGSGTVSQLEFLTGSTPTERCRITEDGKFLVGTSSESGNALLTVRGNTGSATGAGVLDIGLGTTRPGSAGTPLGYLRFTSTSNTSSNYHYAAIYAETDGTSSSDTDIPGRLVFSVTGDGSASPTERMRIVNDGNVLIYGNGNGVGAKSSQAAGTTFAVFVGAHSATSTTTGTNSFLVYTNGNVQNTNNSYAGISDLKLKENIVEAGSQWGDIKAFRVVNYNFKPETNQETHKQIGLIAQEVELVSPGLVSESPDRDAEGNDLGTVTKSVNYSVLYMKAIKALQEAMERIEQLEVEMAAVKSQLS